MGLHIFFYYLRLYGEIGCFSMLLSYLNSADAGLAPRFGAGILPFDRGFSFARDRVVFSARFFAMCVQMWPVRLRRHAPRAGAGIYFLYEKKVNKDSPKGRVSILSPLEPPLNDQRRCLWKPGEAPALVLFHTQARPACEAGV